MKTLIYHQTICPFSQLLHPLPPPIPDNLPGLIPYGIGMGQGQPRFNPVRAPYRDCPWFTHSKVTWTLPIRPRLNPVRGPYGHARGLPKQILPSTPHRNPVRDCTGDHGASQACPYGARSNPGARPVKSRDFIKMQ